MSNTPHRGARVLCSGSCPVHHVETAARPLKPPADGWPELPGLHSLNATRTTWLTCTAIETSIEAYVRGFPKPLQDMIGLGELGLNPMIWCNSGPSAYDAGREKLEQAIATPGRRLVQRMKRREYDIFPVCSNNNHWVLVVLHKSQVASKDDPSKMEWSRVMQAAVLDPYRDDSRIEFVLNTLRKWLVRAADFTFASDFRRNVWVPRQHDTNSCGPRSYWNAKQLLDRLLELHENGVNYDESLWSPLSGWFNESFVREEMTGRCASDLVRKMDYNARVAVEVVQQVKEYSTSMAATENVVWMNAGDKMRPMDMTGQKPEPRPQGFQWIQTPGAGTGAGTGPAPTKAQPPAYPTGAPAPPQTPYVPPPAVPNQHQITPSGKGKI